MLTPFETIAALGVAALAVQSALLYRARKQTAPAWPAKNSNTQTLSAGRDMEHVNQAGRDIHIHPANEKDLNAILKENEFLKRENTHLRKQNRSLVKQITLVLDQLRVKSGLLQECHAQLWEKGQRIQQLEQQQRQVPFLPITART
ncbi:hypothetical protein C8N40_11158 [Pontibacter mucosus]|uniref:Uncharacterized protein n=1 Tax=Pontibacter mucosus TaxID=1649266 RepID=A0A2T5YD20_9BACT|nr:hypothetical protein [Pontibacter mucosus]PTX14393.1 hypothetical protein C8N40_11158 [Pontibacter mucosus]